jgi:hypothetical protein
MFLTFAACNNRPVTAAREYALQYPGQHPDANVFQRLEQRLREVHETGSIPPTINVNAGRPRTVRTSANEDVTVASAEREQW